MKMKSFFVFFFFPAISFAQLTVEKIMRDPNWIGAQPQNPVWSPDGKTLFFDWNPEGKTADSFYRFSPKDKAPFKASYKEGAMVNAMNNGRYNKSYTQLTYAYNGDVYWLDLKTNKNLRLTQTVDAESNPYFIKNDEWIVYTRSQNLYAWHIFSGVTEQLSNLLRTTATGAKMNNQEE